MDEVGKLLKGLEIVANSLTDEVIEKATKEELLEIQDKIAMLKSRLNSVL